MSAKPWAIALTGACLLTACQSSPTTHYFALTAIAPATAPAPQAGQIPLRVERVTIPGELDRLELVRRSSANRLQIAVFDRWAAPLEDMIRRVATADLTARLSPGAVASTTEPAAGEARRRLYIEFEQFAGDERGAVKLQATWLLQAPNAGNQRGSADIASQANDPSAEALAAAMSRALADLCDRIAATLPAQPAGAKSE